MKKILVLTTFILSANVFAATTLVCNDQNSRSVYKLVLNDDNKLSLLPILKDSSALSLSNVALNYNEGESNEVISLYEGLNSNNNTVIVELNKSAIEKGKVAEANVYYTNETNKLVTTKFLCEVK